MILLNIIKFVDFLLKILRNPHQYICKYIIYDNIYKISCYYDIVKKLILGGFSILITILIFLNKKFKRKKK